MPEELLALASEHRDALLMVETKSHSAEPRRCRLQWSSLARERTGSQSDANCPELLAAPHRRNRASPGPSMLRGSTGLAMCWLRRAIACAVAAGAPGWTNQARRLDRPLTRRRGRITENVSLHPQARTPPMNPQGKL